MPPGETRYSSLTHSQGSGVGRTEIGRGLFAGFRRGSDRPRVRLATVQRPPDSYSPRRGGREVTSLGSRGRRRLSPPTLYSILTLSRRSGLKRTEVGPGLLPERGRDGHGGALGTAAGTVLPLMCRHAARQQGGSSRLLWHFFRIPTPSREYAGSLPRFLVPRRGLVELGMPPAISGVNWQRPPRIVVGSGYHRANPRGEGRGSGAGEGGHSC